MKVVLAIAFINFNSSILEVGPVLAYIFCYIVFLSGSNWIIIF